jgi:alpha-D-ribose 1-methylphosphonate 5-triphosphate diphosphatase PhnM
MPFKETTNAKKNWLRFTTQNQACIALSLSDHAPFKRQFVHLIAFILNENGKLNEKCANKL